MRDRSYETGARELLKWLEDRLADFNNNHGDSLEPHDQRDVQGASVSLRSNFDGLARHFFEPARDHDATLPESGYHFTWGLMNACFLVGARTVLSDSAANWKNKQNTNEGRKQKAANDADRERQQFEALVAEAQEQGVPIVNSEGFRKGLLNGCGHSIGIKKRLPSHLIPSDGTLKNLIRKRDPDLKKLGLRKARRDPKNVSNNDQG